MGLLLLTKLGPWTIVFEKLFSRLVPMATFVLLSLPLLAIAYSLGGIEAVDIAKLMWILAITALHIGSFSVLCSAWFRTTAASFLATYVLGALSIVLAGLFFQWASPWGLDWLFWNLLSKGAYDSLFVNKIPYLTILAFGPFILENPYEVIPAVVPRPPAWRQHPFFDSVIMTLPLLGLSLLNVTLARLVLWRRAFVQPRNLMLKLFRSLDAFFHRANHNRLTRGIVLIRESVALPLYHPISWRETSKRSLGTTRYLIRFLLLLEVPVLIMILWPASEGAIRSGIAPAYVAGWILWLVATLVLAIQSTGLIGTERSHQSLDVLLTTPIESDEIVRQKFAGIWRMIRMLWIPFASLYVFQMWWEAWVNTPSGYFNPHPNSPMYVVIRGVLAVALYLPVIAWFGFYQGLRTRSQTQAILSTMTVITILCTVPPLVAWFVTPIPVFRPPMGMYRDPSMFAILNWMSPAFVLSTLGWFDQDWLMMLAHFVAVAFAYLWLVNRSKRTFARRVGRNDGFFEEEIDSPPVALAHEDRMARLRKGRVGMRAKDDLE